MALFNVVGACITRALFSSTSIFTSTVSEQPHNMTTTQTASTTTSKVWLVTGCSTGLGRSLVSAVLARGDKIIATARQVSALKDLENADNVKVLSLDVTADQTELAKKVQEAQSFFGRIDVLVNNAGCVISGVWEELR